MFSQFLVCGSLLSLLNPCYPRTLDSQNLFQSDPSGEQHLAEVTLRDVTYGRCIYWNARGEQVTVSYEERENDLRAKTETRSLLDPITEARICREVVRSKQSNTISQKEVPPTWEIEASELKGRKSFQTTQPHSSTLQPRFVRLVPASQLTPSNASSLFNPFGNFSTARVEVVNISLPILTIPIRWQNVPISILLPTFQNFNIPWPMMGGKK